MTKQQQQQQQRRPKKLHAINPPAIPNTILLSFLLLLLLLLQPNVLIQTTTARKHIATDSFPTNDEYDGNVFDPESLFGAPLGGYARATKSRLAALNLRLVGGASLPLDNMGHLVSSSSSSGEKKEKTQEMDKSDEKEKDGEQQMDAEVEEEKETTATTSKSEYFMLRDGQGRPFTCRVYHEDELEPHSVTGSMFDAPVLRNTQKQTQTQAPLSVSIPPPPPEVVKKAATATASAITTDPNSADKKENDFNKAAGAATGGKHFESDEDYEDYYADIDMLDNTASDAAAKAPSVAKSDTVGSETRGDESYLQQQQQQQQQRREATAAAASSPTSQSTTTHQNRHQQQQQQDHHPHSVRIHPIDIKHQLQKLENMCAQSHQGWWSYEWCYGRTLSQFHLSLQSHTTSDPNNHNHKVTTQSFTVEDMTDLGAYKHQAVLIADHHHNNNKHHKARDDDDNNDNNNHKSGEYSGSILIRETFENGDPCAEAGIRRKATVELSCCTKKEIQGIYKREKKAMMVKNKEDITAQHMIDDGLPLTNLFNVWEEEVCVYKAKACTPVLCVDQFEDSGDEIGFDVVSSSGGGGSGTGAGASASRGGGRTESGGMTGSSSSSSTSSSSNIPSTIGHVQSAMGDILKVKKSFIVNKDDSIRTILKKTLGHRCLIKNNGWWTYEFCHARRVGEYHLNSVLNPATGVMKETKEDEHTLGLYDIVAAENFPDIEEADHVVNVTKNKLGVSKKRSSSRGGGGGGAFTGGNGAMFIQEYLHGDFCRDEDVTDFVDEGIERATTVRFQCGKTHAIKSVNEDSTCHYIFDVTVPELCDHPLFKAPLIKTQVIKCLPAVVPS